MAAVFKSQGTKKPDEKQTKMQLIRYNYKISYV